MPARKNQDGGGPSRKSARSRTCVNEKPGTSGGIQKRPRGRPPSAHRRVEPSVTEHVPEASVSVSAAVNEPDQPTVEEQQPRTVTLGGYCWFCCEPWPCDESVDWSCGSCPRVYHQKCLSASSDVMKNSVQCLLCQRRRVDRTSVKKLIPDKTLASLLQLVYKKVDFLLGPSVSDLRQFSCPEFEEGERGNRMDLTILQDMINGTIPYPSTIEFFSDVNWIYHNCVVYGKDSRLVMQAKIWQKQCEEELIDVEACPDCYRKTSSFESRFTELCQEPHTLVWAKMKGYPYWPAKVLNVIDGRANLRFFGKHEKAKLSISDCLMISEKSPNQSVRDKAGFSQAVAELKHYVENIINKHGTFQYDAVNTPFRPGNCNFRTRPFCAKPPAAKYAANGHKRRRPGRPPKAKRNFGIRETTPEVEQPVVYCISSDDDSDDEANVNRERHMSSLMSRHGFPEQSSTSGDTNGMHRNVTGASNIYEHLGANNVEPSLSHVQMDFVVDDSAPQNGVPSNDNPIGRHVGENGVVLSVIDQIIHRISANPQLLFDLSEEEEMADDRGSPLPTGFHRMGVDASTSSCVAGSLNGEESATDGAQYMGQVCHPVQGVPTPACIEALSNNLVDRNEMKIMAVVRKFVQLVCYDLLKTPQTAQIEKLYEEKLEAMRVERNSAIGEQHRLLRNSNIVIRTAKVTYQIKKRDFEMKLLQASEYAKTLEKKLKAAHELKALEASKYTKTLEKKVEVLEKKAEVLEKKVEDANNLADQLRNNHETYRSEAEAKITLLNATKQNCDFRMARTRGRSRWLRIAVSNLKKDAADLKATVVKQETDYAAEVSKMKNIISALENQISSMNSRVIDSRLVHLRSEEIMPRTIEASELNCRPIHHPPNILPEEALFCESATAANRNQSVPSAYLDKSLLNPSPPNSMNELLAHAIHDLRTHRLNQTTRSECPSAMPELNPIHPETRNLAIYTPHEPPSLTPIRSAHLLPSPIPSVHPSDCPANLSISACSSGSSTSRRTHRGRPSTSRVRRGGFPQ